MTDSFEILTPDELAEERVADGAEIGDEEPAEVADPVDDDAMPSVSSLAILTRSPR